MEPHRDRLGISVSAGSCAQGSCAEMHTTGLRTNHGNADLRTWTDENVIRLSQGRTGLLFPWLDVSRVVAILLWYQLSYVDIRDRIADGKAKIVTYLQWKIC